MHNWDGQTALGDDDDATDSEVLCYEFLQMINVYVLLSTAAAAAALSSIYRAKYEKFSYYSLHTHSRTCTNIKLSTDHCCGFVKHKNNSHSWGDEKLGEWNLWVFEITYFL